jgi:hypothetical protein
MTPRRELRDRCPYYETRFCASGQCPRTPPCAQITWHDTTDCHTCTQAVCPCWCGCIPAEDVSAAYKAWKSVYEKYADYDEDEELYGAW